MFVVFEREKEKKREREKEKRERRKARKRYLIPIGPANTPILGCCHLKA